MISTCFDAKALSSGSPKYKDVLVPTQKSWHYSDKNVKILKSRNC